MSDNNATFTARAIAVRHNGPTGMFCEYGKAEADVLKTVPASHNRIVIEKTEDEYKSRVLNACYGEADVNEGDWVYYTHRENLGNKKYPYIVSRIEYGKIKSIGPQAVVMANGDRPFRSSVIAVFTGAA